MPTLRRGCDSTGGSGPGFGTRTQVRDSGGRRIQQPESGAQESTPNATLTQRAGTFTTLIRVEDDPLHHHRDIRGGGARAAVFGVSDGLVTNVSLVLGMAGANPGPGSCAWPGWPGWWLGPSPWRPASTSP